MPSEPPDTEAVLAATVERVAPLLPGQGPIGEFVHHNPLHAFEHLPFEEAVLAAGERLGCAPFWPEARYREALRAGRITMAELEATVAADLGARGDETIARLVTRHTLRLRVAAFGIPGLRGPALAWRIGETDAVDRFRDDLPRPRGGDGEARALWEACLEAAGRAPHAEPPRPLPSARRHRDALLAIHGIDSDDEVHPPLIRFVAAYLDQGLAHWPMPLRERGIHACFVETYGAFFPRRLLRWGRALRRLVDDDRAAMRRGLSSLAHSLDALGLPVDRWEAFLSETALALRGWAGMVRQIEERPDRVPARPLPATLVDFLAVRLLLERAVVEAWLGGADLAGSLAERLDRAGEERPESNTPPSPAERAWPLFHLAQLCDIDAVAVARATATDIQALEAELATFDPIARQRALHLAYERHLRHRFLDAITAQEPSPEPAAPAFQAIFCIDEREESFRRHLEEVDEGAETFGLAGFFGVAMYYQSATDAHPRPLCPVAIEPAHYVGETHVDRRGLTQRFQRLRERSRGLVDKNIHLGSRTLVRGTIVMTLLGVLSIVPLVLRVVFPWLGRRLTRFARPRPPPTRLLIEPTPAPPPIGERAGFEVEEMASIVRGQLETLGIAGRMAPLVLVIGHGSSSLNNPHESAHDCGACGGGHGGPNARAFAQMANDPRVRAQLAKDGLLAEGTWFVGAERNTASNTVTFFDEDLLPAATRPHFERAREAIEEARRREAHERCRRFAGVPTWLSPRAALRHVEARSADLAQPRPEYGHATNAFCVVGRRATTKTLFLDRRAFLVSYDARHDDGGRSLARLLAAVVPVVAGINLEYYFGTVDPTGYGCGTKLPHNVTALLGVMDGAESDLRTGLPWQMIEIHEPVRLAMLVEAPRRWLARAIEEHDSVRRLVDNRWLFVTCLDDGAVWERDGDAFVRRTAVHPPVVVMGGSADYYRGARGPLGFARLTRPAA